MKISDKAVEAIRASNKLRGRLMGAFDRSYATIENWMLTKDVRLTAAEAVQIIQEETGLLVDEILDTVELTKVAS